MKEKMKNVWNNVTMKICNGILSEKKVRGEGHYVAVAVIVAVAIAIGFLFKTQMVALFSNWFPKLGTEMNGLL